MKHKEDIQFIVCLLLIALTIDSLLFLFIHLFGAIFALGFVGIFFVTFSYCKIMEDLRS